MQGGSKLSKRLFSQIMTIRSFVSSVGGKSVYRADILGKKPSHKTISDENKVFSGSWL